MTRALIVLVALTLGGCGGKTATDRSATPCLRQLGLYADHGVPKELTILGFVVSGVPPPPTVTDVADLSYLTPGSGARTAELYVTDGVRSAVAFERIWGGGRTTVGNGRVALLWRNPPSTRNGTVSRFGRTVVFWTTTPSVQQRDRLGACLGR